MRKDNKLIKKYMPLIAQGKTNFPYLLIVIVIAIIAGGGVLFYYYSWIADLDTRLTQIESKLPEVKVPGEISIDETANWETYTNLTLGFSLKYPPTVSKSFVAYSSGSGGNNILGIKGPTQTEGTGFHDGLTIFIKSLDFKDSLQNTVTNDRGSIKNNELAGVAYAYNVTIKFTTTIIKVGGVTGIKQTTNPGSSDFIYLYLKNGDVLRFAGRYVGAQSNEYKSIFYNMLSTFKLLE